MLALLSPAKRLDSKPRPEIAGTTTPDFLDESAKLVERLKKYSAKRLGTLMGINEKLAAENHKRFQALATAFHARQCRARRVHVSR